MIFFVRHGETDWNIIKKVQGKADIELNKNGIEQAKIVAKKLKYEKIDLIISSPLKRAVQTASIIALELGCNVVYEEGMSERDFGEYEGAKRDEFDVELIWSYEKNETYERAENIRSFFDRVYRTLDGIREKYKGENILIVSHGGVSIPVNCYFNGIPKNRSLRILALHNCEVARYDEEGK